MKKILIAVTLAALTGCAGLGDNMRRAADSINHGVARAPDARVTVENK